jgi:hypothetical protein
MLKIVNMSKVSQCKVSECAYNADNACHAIAITVGDGDNPMCDTFFQTGSHCGAKATAGVGACKVSACRHNQDFECSAGYIQIGNMESKVRCMTFAMS